MIYFPPAIMQLLCPGQGSVQSPVTTPSSSPHHHHLQPPNYDCQLGCSVGLCFMITLGTTGWDHISLLLQSSIQHHTLLDLYQAIVSIMDDTVLQMTDILDQMNECNMRCWMLQHQVCKSSLPSNILIIKTQVTAQQNTLLPCYSICHVVAASSCVIAEVWRGQARQQIIDSRYTQQSLWLLLTFPPIVQCH